MQDDFRKLIYGVLIAFILVLLGWISFVYVSGCGFSLDCPKGAQLPARTPIPTLIPARLPAPVANHSQPVKVACQIAAVDLLGAWVSAGYSDSEPFTFTDISGKECVGNFSEDIYPLFSEGNLWYTGAPACITCHQADLKVAQVNLSLVTYQDILAGSRRTSPDATGNDILGGGDWQTSLLYSQLFIKKVMPLGRPSEVPAEGPIVFAGSEQ